MLDLMSNLEKVGVEVEFVLLETVPGEAGPAAWDALPTPGECAFARAHMAASRPDAVLVNYMYLAELLDHAPAGTLKCVLTIDVCCLRRESFCREGLVLDGTAWSREAEAGLLAKADLLVAIQDEEAEVLRELAPGCEVITAPISMTPRPLGGGTVPGRCLFVGSDADHNRFSLLWFLDHVWELVLAERPDATLSVCGTVNHRIFRCFPGVTMHGRVEDLTPEYAKAQACVVPLRVGSGLEIKLVEGMGHGKACVVSSRGLLALPPGCREAVLAGEDAPSFAQAVLRVLDDPALRCAIGEAALDCVAAHFSPEAAYGPLAARLKQAARS